MPTTWPDIPGVTAVGGRPRLPRSPEVAVRGLLAALEGAGTGLTLPELAQRIQRETHSDRARAEGLAGWLPLSHVVRWDERGDLLVDPRTDLHDLALRYAAWVSTQPVPAEFADASRAYATRVGELAAELLRAGDIRHHRGQDTGWTEHEQAEAEAIAQATDGPLVDPSITDRVRQLLAALDATFLERRQHTRAALLALLAGQHVLLLGPPGTAKSMLARGLCRCFSEATYFEYLLSRFTHPDELFGPVSIPGLKEEDYRRLIEGYLPTAHVAFLDEIFKANSAILNSLLTLINERVFHHGRHRDRVPLIGLIGASNELPDPEGGLGALYDRFLVRLTVPPLAGADAFLSVATGNLPQLKMADDAPLSAEDLRALRAAADQVVVPPEVSDALVSLWQQASRLEWEVSDRRWRQAVGMLKIGAAADGRRTLTAIDLLLLEPVLSPTPDRAPEVREAILEQLGTGTAPEHDLRAQWMLLSMDRVAPANGHAYRPPDEVHGGWQEQLQLRQENLTRFLWHHERAVQRLKHDRGAVDALADQHLWLASLPAQVLATHITASRDLAHILTLAEDYERALSSPEHAAKALVETLPATSKRVYGHGAVLALHIPQAGVRYGITLAGEREVLPGGGGGRPRDDGLVQPAMDDRIEVPELSVEPRQFLDWVQGDLDTDQLTSGLPAWSSRNIGTALQSARRVLRHHAVPAPPSLRQP